MKYYIVKNGDKEGPFNIDELKIYDLKEDSLVWHEGLNDWQKAKEIETLKSFFNDSVSKQDSVEKNKEIKTDKPLKSKNDQTPLIKKSEENALINEKEKITSIHLILGHIFISLLYTFIVHNNELSSFDGADQFIETIFFSVGSNFVFYGGLFIRIFVKYSRTTWIILITIQWSLTLLAFIGNNSEEFMKSIIH